MLFPEQEYGNSTESSSINYDEIWKPRMREVGFDNDGFSEFATVIRCYNAFVHL